MYSSELYDFGDLSTEIAEDDKGQWAGMRLILFTRAQRAASPAKSALASAQEEVRQARRSASEIRQKLDLARQRITAIDAELRLANEKTSSLERELRAAAERASRLEFELASVNERRRVEIVNLKQQLHAIETSRTWRVGQRLACSWLGRSLRWFERHILRRRRLAE